MTHRRASAVGEFMKIGLTDENGARILQPPDNFCILRRHTILEQLTGCGSPYARGVHVVLQRDGNTMKRASPPAPLALCVHLARPTESLLRGDRDERIERRVVRLNPLEAGLREFDRGNRPAAQ